MKVAAGVNMVRASVLNSSENNESATAAAQSAPSVMDVRALAVDRLSLLWLCVNRITLSSRLRASNMLNRYACGRGWLETPAAQTSDRA
jgi:hypothetical protein